MRPRLLRQELGQNPRGYIRIKAKKGSMASLVLVGGGHCHACSDRIKTAGGYVIACFIQPKSAGLAPVLVYPVLGDDEALGCTQLEQLPDFLASKRRQYHRCCKACEAQAFEALPHGRRSLRLKAEPPGVKAIIGFRH